MNNIFSSRTTLLFSFVLGFPLITIAACSSDGKPSNTTADAAPDSDAPADSGTSGNALPRFGVNLAGAEFGEDNMPGVFNVHYTYPTNDELDYYKSKGIGLIRLPFRWERLQRTLGGPLNGPEISRLRGVVSAAAERDVLVLFDLHNSARYVLANKEVLIGMPGVTNENIVDFWTKLADEFKQETNIWGYGIMNEPYDMADNQQWFGIAQAIITGIRTVDNSTPIVVGGDSYSSAERWLEASDNLKNLHDPADNLIFEAHVYFDQDASGRYQKSYDDEGASPTSGVDRVRPFIEWLKTNNFKGYIGEYGIPADDARWLITLDNFLTYISDNCVNGTYWAGGPWWGEYILTIEPKPDGADRVQMSVVQNHLNVNSSCAP